jgi:hypothetical protein
VAPGARVRLATHPGAARTTNRGGMFERRTRRRIALAATHKPSLAYSSPETASWSRWPDSILCTAAIPPRASPGKLTLALAITCAHNGADITRGALVVRSPTEPRAFHVETTSRIGITKCADWTLRFVIRPER